MGYKFGSASQRHMQGIRADLVQVAEDAIKISPVDMTVTSNGGLRTASMQMALYKKGASKLDGRNVKSKHQKQKDGFGWAIDLVPWVSGSPRWEWPLIYPIAACMAISAQKRGVQLRWGGVWDRELSQIMGKGKTIDEIADNIRREVKAYCIRHPGPDFIDGPHYELMG